jgi:hypothetical protein
MAIHAGRLWFGRVIRRWNRATCGVSKVLFCLL